MKSARAATMSTPDLRKRAQICNYANIGAGSDLRGPSTFSKQQKVPQNTKLKFQQ